MFRINRVKMRLFGVQIHAVWSEPVALNSKPETVGFGSVQLQSREVTATSTESRAVFKPASLDTDSTGAAVAQALFAKDLPSTPGSSGFFCFT